MHKFKWVFRVTLSPLSDQKERKVGVKLGRQAALDSI
jgi:hypothetical protein